MYAYAFFDLAYVVKSDVEICRIKTLVIFLQLLYDKEERNKMENMEINLELPETLQMNKGQKDDRMHQAHKNHCTGNSLTMQQVHRERYAGSASTTNEVNHACCADNASTAHQAQRTVFAHQAARIQKEQKNRIYSLEEISKYVAEVRLLLTDEAESLTDEKALGIIEAYVFSIQKAQSCSYRENLRLIERLFLSLRKEMDILQPYIDDKSISEIMVNGKDNIFVERSGKVERLPLSFDRTEDLEELIRRVVGKNRRELTELNPIVDARLSDGSRVNAVYKNIALNGPILTIRKFPDKVMTMEDLIRKGTLTAEVAAFLKVLVRSGYNCFVCGGTSSGKTTLLNVLSQFIPPQERVVVIEDSAELQIEQVENIVRLECRNANVQGKGQVDMSQLVKASLRMRPDRIIVGEVRGKEVMDMIQAMNTGHDGSLSTAHANSISGMLKRLEAMFLQAADFPVEAIRNQIMEGIDIMIHMSRMRDGSRKVVEIAEIAGMDSGQIKLNLLFRQNLGMTGNPLLHREKLSLAGYGKR